MPMTDPTLPTKRASLGLAIDPRSNDTAICAEPAGITKPYYGPPRKELGYSGGYGSGEHFTSRWSGATKRAD